MTTDKHKIKVEYPEVIQVPDYPLSVPKSLVTERKLPPPDGKIHFDKFILPEFKLDEKIKKTLEEKIDSAIRNSVVTIEDDNIVCKKLFPPHETIII